LQYGEKDLQHVEVPLVGSVGHATYLLRMKRLLVRVGDKNSSQTVEMNFLVVDIPMASNIRRLMPTKP